MGKASQTAYERGFIAGSQYVRSLGEVEAWRSKCHDVPYQPARPFGGYTPKVETDPKEWMKWAEVVKKSYQDVQNYRLGEPSVIQSFGKGTLFEPVEPEHVDMSDDAITARLDEAGAFEPVTKTNEQIDFTLDAYLEKFGISPRRAA